MGRWTFVLALLVIGCGGDGGGGYECICCGTSAMHPPGGTCGDGFCDPYCGPADAGRDSAIDPTGCPAGLPTLREPCTSSDVGGYIDCASFGVARVSCAGGRVDSIDTTSCAPIDCQGMTCTEGQYCQINVGGAVIPFCTPAPTGPISCVSVCGGPCDSSVVTPSPPEVVTCNTCPSGTCP